MKVKRFGSSDSCEVVVRTSPDDGFRYNMDTSQETTRAIFSFGKNGIPNMSDTAIAGLLDDLPHINKITIPESVPAQAAPFVKKLLDLNRDTEIDDTPIVINQFQGSDPWAAFIPNGTPMSIKKQDLDSVPDGFIEIKDKEISPADGFHEIRIEDEDEDAPTSPAEKREMWVEDPNRMNRLSFAYVGAIRGEKTFPKELGGGRI